MNLPNLTYQNPTTWDNIFSHWEELEGHSPDWLAVAQAKGFETWKQWCQAWVAQFQAPQRSWQTYAIENPLQTIPNFLIGPTQGWQKHFAIDEQNKHTFQTLVQRVNFEHNSKVQAIINDFPTSSQYFGILLPSHEVVLIEGHHRACALAVLEQQGGSLDLSENLIIHLTQFKTGEQALLDAILQRGSSKQ